MKRAYRNAFFLLLSGLFIILTSCSNITGYGMLLWGIPEYHLQDGDIVPVYIKSNISHVYVVGLPENGGKIEIDRKSVV